MRATLLRLLCVAMWSYSAFAQTNEADQASEKISGEELQQIVAPIALYPDNLLSQILMASTYPLEVVEADRWVKQNSSLQGDALKAELDKKSWDESVKTLVLTPSVLHTMSEQLSWTQRLGDAMLSQQGEVMDTVQTLRQKAYAQKTLVTTEQQTVSTESQNGQQVIVIEPAQANTVYVPYYNPTTAYGGWAYPAYPPAYYPPPPGYAVGSALMGGLFFGAGLAIADDIWDDDCDWGGGNIDIDNEINIDRGDRTRIADRSRDRVNHRGEGGKRWQHNPAHRHGVKYRDVATQQRFDRGTSREALRKTTNDRMAYRGREGGAVANRQPSARPAVTRGSGTSHAANRPASRVGQGGGGTRRPAANQSGLTSQAFSNIGSGRSARAESHRGRTSFAQANLGGSRSFGGGGRGGGRVGGGGRGGGRGR